MRIEQDQAPREQLSDQVGNQNIVQSGGKQQQGRNDRYDMITRHIIMKEGLFVYDDCQIMAD